MTEKVKLDGTVANKAMPLLNGFDEANLCLDYQLIRKRTLTFDLYWCMETIMS